MSTELDQRLQCARQIAREAGQLTLRYFQTDELAVEQKQDASPVTIADREAELLLRDRIAAAFPDDAILGEEFPERQGNSGYRWILDPIDGTRSFVRGYPMFSTQIALMHAGEIVLGVSAAPAYGERAWAVRGGGAWLGSNEQDARRVQVSAAQAFDSQAAVSTGNLKSLAASPARWAAYADIVRRDPECASLAPFYQDKRDLFLRLLEGSRFRPLPCHGTYFQLLDYSDISDDGDDAFARTLLVEHGVAAIPLSPFMRTPGARGVLRFCFAKQDDTLRRAAERLVAV